MNLEQLASALQSELESLKASTNFNAYSGLTVEVRGETLIAFDEYDSIEIHNPSLALGLLMTLPPIDWSLDLPYPFEPIWDALVSVN